MARRINVWPVNADRGYAVGCNLLPLLSQTVAYSFNGDNDCPKLKDPASDTREESQVAVDVKPQLLKA